LFLNSRPGEPDWPEIVRAVGLEHLEGDERFASFRARRKNGAALVEAMDAIFATQTLAEWGARLDAEGLIWSPVQSFEQALDDPQLRAAGVIVDMPKTDGTSYPAPASPIRFGDESTDPKGPTPEIGQHTLSILGDMGVDQEALSDLLEKKIIRQHQD
jgi:crotonobetainyl-CoA:carnitine CoA-transferase CaiB-like acyl-CoA transferase